MVATEHIGEIRLVCASATERNDGGQDYIHLPVLKLPEGCNPTEVEALLCLSQHGGYSTRLFLSQVIPGRGANWSPYAIFGRTWYTWSWNHVPNNLRPMEILAEHLRGLR